MLSNFQSVVAGAPLSTHSRVEFDEPRTPKQAIHHFLDGKINSTSYASILDSCTCPKLGKQVHAHLHKHGFHGREFVQTRLLKMYGKCGCVDDVVKVFDKMSERNLYTYTAILNVLLDNGLFEEALVYFEMVLFEGVELEFFVFPVALKVCCGYGGVELGRQLHGLATKIGVSSHIYVGNALIDMYGKCGSLDDAKMVLYNMFERDCVSWNSIVITCATNGMVFEALRFMEEMSKEHNLTPNFVSWNALIGGFAQNGFDKEAILMLRKMIAKGFEPNARTLASVLPACVRLRKIDLGKEIYGYITRRGFMSSPYIVNGLIDLYRRCGDMGSAFEIFSNFSERDKVSFNTVIAGYCDNGEIHKAKELFDKMEYEGKSKDLISWNSMITGYVDNSMFNEALMMFIDLMNEGGVKPNSFTLGSVIGACADIGSLRLGKSIHSYCIVRGLETNVFVGGALVEMYSRFGDLGSAEKALRRVPVDPDPVIWGALLGGCIIHGDVDLGEIAAHKLIDLEPGNPGNYVMLANLYASNGKWNELRKIRQQMKDGQLNKNPGCSWIEDRDETHVFMASDRTHKRAKEIYDMLDNLTVQMRLEQV